MLQEYSQLLTALKKKREKEQNSNAQTKAVCIELRNKGNELENILKEFHSLDGSSRQQSSNAYLDEAAQKEAQIKWNCAWPGTEGIDRALTAIISNKDQETAIPAVEQILQESENADAKQQALLVLIALWESLLTPKRYSECINAIDKYFSQLLVYEGISEKNRNIYYAQWGMCCYNTLIFMCQRNRKEELCREQYENAYQKFAKCTEDIKEVSDYLHKGEDYIKYFEEEYQLLCRIYRDVGQKHLQEELRRFLDNVSPEGDNLLKNYRAEFLKKIFKKAAKMMLDLSSYKSS